MQVANDPRVDALRAKMQVRENAAFTQDYYDPQKRYIGNAVQVFFKDGSCQRARGGGFPDRASQAPRRRACRCWSRNSRAALPAHFQPKQTESIKAMFADRKALLAMPVSDFVAKLVTACVKNSRPRARIMTHRPWPKGGKSG